MTTTRRSVLAGLAGLPLLQASPSLAQAVAQKVKTTIGVGMFTEGSALVAAMEAGDLINKAATELHTALELETLDFQVLLRMVQGIVAGQIQIGMLGSTPMIRMLSTANPAIPLALAGGGVNFPLLVTPDSKIRSLQDLPGKTVLTLVGSDLHLVLTLMLKAEFGHDDVKKLGIVLRNAQANPDLARRQPGVDVIAGTEPYAATAERTGELVALARNNGTTGAAWDGPEGKGAGHVIANFKATRFAPEAYYPHRIWWAARRDYVEQHQTEVAAFLVANARAAEQMSAAPLDDLIKMGGAKWAGELGDQRKFAERILWRKRGWAWATEGDVQSLIQLSSTKAIYENELKAENVKKLIALAAPAARRAWEMMQMRPAMAVFTDPNAPDRRGLPLWDVEKWSL
jgi:ABC-type nitrate/sulfonate/bicarbonate transport system substrate-binding protein